MFFLPLSYRCPLSPLDTVRVPILPRSSAGVFSPPNPFSLLPPALELGFSFFLVPVNAFLSCFQDRTSSFFSPPKRDGSSLSPPFLLPGEAGRFPPDTSSRDRQAPFFSSFLFFFPFFQIGTEPLPVHLSFSLPPLFLHRSHDHEGCPFFFFFCKALTSRLNPDFITLSLLYLPFTTGV